MTRPTTERGEVVERMARYLCGGRYFTPFAKLHPEMVDNLLNEAEVTIRLMRKAGLQVTIKPRKAPKNG